MGIAVSLILIAIGAILTWAVSAEPEGLDVNVVGVVLMIVGLVGFLLSILYWSSWGGPAPWRRRAYVEDDVPRRRYARRRGYVEDDVPARRETYVEEEDVPRRRYVEEEDVAGPPGPPP